MLIMNVVDTSVRRDDCEMVSLYCDLILVFDCCFSIVPYSPPLENLRVREFKR